MSEMWGRLPACGGLLARLALATTFLAAALSAADAPRRAPSFALPDSQSHYHDILDYRGKPLIIEIMSTRCEHCQELAVTLEKVAAHYGNKISILSVVLPPDNQQTVGGFIRKYNVTHPVLFDCSQMTASYFNATPDNPHIDVPHLFFVDSNGIIQDDFMWAAPPEGKPADFEINAVIDRLLK
jgi:thiol-disulfide isomerase/thioredoxin